MVFYTCADSRLLPYARALGQLLKQHPEAHFYLVLCDKLPPNFDLEAEPFDKVLLSSDLAPTEKISSAYWHYLHTPDALLAAMKPIGAKAILDETDADGILYLAPNASGLSGLELISARDDIFMATRMNLGESVVNPMGGMFYPGFFAVKNTPNGMEFLTHWAEAAANLWRTNAPLTAQSYNALMDMAPVLYQRVCTVRDAVFNTLPIRDLPLPNIYDTYDNGQLIPDAHRLAAREDAKLLEAYAETDPFNTTESDCLYKALQERDSQNGDGLYWDEYQEVIHSSSYRFGRKVMDLACKIAPPGSKRRQLISRLRGEKGKVPLEEVVTLPEPQEDIELVPLELESCNFPMFSILLHSCTSLNDAYAALASVINGTPGSSFELLVSGNFCEADREKLQELIPNITLMETESLAEMLDTAKGKYALLMGEHMRMEDGKLTEALNAMETIGCGIMQTAVVFADDTIYEAGGVMTQAGRRLTYGFGLNKELGCVRYRKDIDCASLYGTYIDLTAMREQELHLRDDLSPIYALADLSFRMRQADEATKYVPTLTLSDCRSSTVATPAFAPSADAYAFTCSWLDVLMQENIKDESEMFLGRDRSVGKKTIFSVDDNIPCYDLSAGDRTTYHYYEVLADMGYNLKIVGDDYARREPYASMLEEKGIEVVAADGGGEVEYRQFLKDNGKFIDTAYLNRPNNLQKYYDVVKKYCDCRVVYCCMDLHFLRELREHEVKGNKKEAERVKAYAKEEIARMDLADVVFSVSTYEKSILDPELKHAVVEVNPIFIYRDFPEAPDHFDRRKDLLFVGSFKHPGNLDGVKWMCKEIMPLITKELPDVKLHLVGAHPTPEIEALANDHVIVHGFLSDEDLEQMYRNSRLSVVPLRFGAGVKGKVLEAMYNGLPIVSTAIGTEGIPDIEACIENTDTPEAFSQKVIELYNDTDRLQEMGVANWQYVQDHLGVAPAEELFRRSF